VLVYGVKGKSRKETVLVWAVRPLLPFSEGVGWGVDGAIVLRFARSREKGLLALIADDAHGSSVLLVTAMSDPPPR
jgi:hypothetical protein